MERTLVLSFKDADEPELAAPHFDPGIRDKQRSERRFALCERMIDIAAAFFSVASKDLRDPGRSDSDTARVRQVAMYVSHVVLGLNFTEIGHGFGRNRSTVMHACHTIEDLRDDEEFDRVIGRLEAISRAAFAGTERY